MGQTKFSIVLQSQNVCPIQSATWRIFTQQGPNNVLCYPYDNQQIAIKKFNSWYCARILYHEKSQIDRRGQRFALKTISDVIQDYI